MTHPMRQHVEALLEAIDRAEVDDLNRAVDEAWGALAQEDDAVAPPTRRPNVSIGRGLCCGECGHAARPWVPGNTNYCLQARTTVLATQYCTLFESRNPWLHPDKEIKDYTDD